MTFLPIVDRELRISSRSAGTYRLRWIFAGSVLVIWFFLLYSTHPYMSPVQRGRALFMAVGIPAFAFALFSGAFLTADCLSEERREGTLGLLFLTNLKGYDIIMGKLIATSLNAFYGLLAILPLLSLPLLIGGVSAGQFWRVTLALITIMLLSLSIGMFVSAASRETRASLGASLLTLILLAGGPPAIWAMGKAWGFGSVPDKLLYLSPGYFYGQAQDVYIGSVARISRFAECFMLMLAMALLCLIGASLWIRHAWRDKVENSAPKAGRSGRSAFRFVSRNVAFIRNEKNPCYWLFYRDRQAERVAGIVIPALFLIWLCCIPGCFSRQFGTRDRCFSLVMFIAFGTHFLLKVHIAIEASRRLNEDRRSGALELLLSTPVTVSDIISAQIRALRDMFLVPVVVLCLMNAIMLWVLAVGNPMKFDGEGKFVMLEGYTAGMIILFLDARTLSWLGMWMGFKQRRHHRAIFMTLGAVIIVPWVCVFLFMLSTNGRGINTGTMSALATMYFVVTAGANFLVSAWAQQTLARELRETGPRISQFAPLTLPLAPLTSNVQ